MDQMVANASSAKTILNKHILLGWGAYGPIGPLWAHRTHKGPYGPTWAQFWLIIIKFNENHKIANKNIKGVKSLKEYFRGFAIRTCLLLTP